MLKLNLLKKLKTNLISRGISNLNKNEKLNIQYDVGALELQSGKFARLADSSATGNIKNTNVLVTVVSKSRSGPSTGFLPLTVEYCEKASAAGRIPGGYFRRDLFASNKEILISRMIDRSLRPLFPAYFTNDTQIVCNLMALDDVHNQDVISINTASYALHTSDIPWNGPVGCVRVGQVGSKLVINPSREQLLESPLNLVITASENNNIVMLEGWANNMEQKEFIEALQFGTYEAGRVIDAIKQSKYAQSSKRSYEVERQSPELEKLNEAISTLGRSKIYEVLTTYTHNKRSRDEAINEIRYQVGNVLFDEKEYFKSKHMNLFNECYSALVKSVLRDLIVDESKRVDGRHLDEVRSITSEIGLFENLHGSALFQRGQTQVLCTLTFDSPYAMYAKEGVQAMVSPSLTKLDKKFMLHYDFPSYATNEIGKQGGRADRREVGHGALAEKAVYPIVPANFPFTIRLLCEVLESNGSSSMASVCAGSLALLEAGVGISEPVCGVAMGLVTRTNQHGKIESYKVLADILGMEDYAGDMDFKIAGTASGITAVQADIKLSGLPLEIAIEAIEKSKSARLHILEKMSSTIKEANLSKKHTLPQMKEIGVPIHKRSQFIGAGGSNLKKIQQIGVSITPIDETKFNLFAPNIQLLNEAEDMISSLLDQKREPNFEFGGIYSAKVVEIVPNGVMVQLYSTMKPTLLPNSQIDARPIQHGSSSGLSVGQEIQVKYFGRDPNTGQMRLSRKVLFMTNFRTKNLLEKFQQENKLDLDK